MAQNKMSVGRDYTFGYYDADTGEMIDLGDIQNIHVTAQKHTIKNQPYNDDPSFAYIEDGYAFRFTITRVSPALENFQLDRAAAFSAGKSSTAGYLNETVTEADGSQSKYQYLRFVFHLDDIGDITRENAVRQQGEGLASKKIRIG